MARPRSDIAGRIVAAARERFLKQGVDGASLREIAHAARTSIGMVYYYFPSKDDLLLAVVEEVYVGLMAGVTAALATDAPIQVRLQRLYARVGSLDATEFDVIRIVLREALVSSDRVRKLFERFLQDGGHVQLIVRTALEGMSAGVLRADLPPLVLVVAIMSLGLTPVVARRLAVGAVPGLDLPPPEEMADTLTKALLEGIGAKGSARSPRARSARRSPRA